MESLCRRTVAAGSLEPVTGLWLSAVGGGRRSASAGRPRGPPQLGRGGVVDRPGRPDADRTDAGGHGGRGVSRGSRFRCRPCARRRRAAADRRGGGPAVVDRVVFRVRTGRFAVCGSGSVRGPRRTGTRHPGQPGRPGRDLERRSGTWFADNGIRSGGDTGVAGGGGVRVTGAAASASGGTAADFGGGDPADGGGDGHRPRLDGAALGGRGGSRPGRAARRPEVDGVGDAGLCTGRCGCGGDAAAPGTSWSKCRGLRRRDNRSVTRPRLGSGRTPDAGALPRRVVGGGGPDQRRPAGCRSAAGRDDAAIRLGRTGAGARPTAAVGSRRRAVHRRPCGLRTHRAG